MAGFVNDAPIGQDIPMRLRILKGVDRSLDIITVGDICKNAGISRQTFYNHFDSKYSLASWWVDWCASFFLDRIGLEYSWEEGILRHNHLLFSNSEFLFNALSSKAVLPFLGAEQVSARRREAFLEALEKRGVAVDFMLEEAVDSFSSYLGMGGYRLFRGRKPEAPNAVHEARKYLAVVPAPLYAALQLPEYANCSQLENLAKVEAIAQRIFIEASPLAFLFS